MTKNVVVIGGGIGGCAAGALLAVSGFRVMLLEADATLGGRAKSFPFRRFLVDNGAHDVNHVDCTSIGRVLEETKPELELVDADLPKVFDPVRRTFHEGMSYAKATLMPQQLREAEGILERVRKMPLEEIEKYHDLVAAEWLEGFTKQPEILSPWLSEAGLGLGESTQITATIFLHTLRNMLISKRFNLCYPRKGGIGAICTSLARVITQHGGEVICNARVNSIGVKDGRANGVKASIAPFGSSFSQELSVDSPLVVSSIPLAGIFSILPREVCDRSFIEYVERWHDVSAQITVGLVLAAKRSVIKPTWYAATYPLPESRIDRDTIQEYRIYEVPTVLSPSLGPEGYDLLYAEYNSYNSQMMKRKHEIQRQMREELFEVFPSLEQDHEWISPYVVSCRTYAHTIGYSRLHDVAVPGIEGMYLCGDQIAGYGEAGKNGITRAFSSALKCANKIRGRNGAISF